MKTLILGMGNTLLSDDGIGIITKRYLEKRLGNKDNNIDFCETSWGGFRIIDLLRGYNHAIIVDSIKTASKPLGYIHYLQPTDLLPSLRLNSYHDINFITALRLAEELGSKIPSTIDIYAVEIVNNNTIREAINPSLWNSIFNCSKTIIEKLASRGLLKRENQNSLFPIRTYKEMNELYLEDSSIDNSILTENINNIEEYRA